MSGSQSTQTRRALLRGGSLALITSIGGCLGLGASDSDDSSNPDSGSPSESEPNGTPTPPEGEFPFMHPASGTTDYGVALDNVPVMGSNDAPVDLYYWSDYLCPHCSTFAEKIHPKIGHNAVADGTLRVVFLQFPVIAENSWPAAVLAKCVWKEVADSDPNRFWEWHHAIFKHQGEEGSGWADIEKLLSITDDAGFDTEPLRSRIKNQEDEIKTELQAEIKAAEQAEFRGTPAFVFVNKKTEKKKKIAGTHPYPLFKKAIQSVR